MTPPPAATPATFDDATCPACGCLCDDLTLVVSGGRVVEARRACEAGRAWFLADPAPGDRPAAMIDGKPADPAEALDRAAALLAAARAPLVTGLTRTTVEAQAQALALADRLGAAVILPHAASAAGRLRALARVGRVSATLGEVRHRADLVVYWGIDPVATHPRHWERFIEPAGRFVPGGRADRTVLVADDRPSPTAARADLALTVRPEARFATAWALRALVGGADLEDADLHRSTGLDPGPLRAWADRLTAARYGVLFSPSDCDAAEAEALSLLVADLNAGRRFVSVSLGSAWNAAGAEAVLTWQAGYPLAADFAPGVPRAVRPDLSAWLERGSADAALIVADDVSPALSPAALAALGRIPSVLLAPDATAPGRSATVALACATPGLHTPGTIARADGPSLPMRPVLASPLASDRDLLRALLDRLPARDPVGWAPPTMNEHRMMVGDAHPTGTGEGRER